MSSGRLEAQITVPSGGWSASLTVTSIGGPYALSWTAGATYYPAELLTDLASKLNAAAVGDGTFAVSASLTDGTGTGLVTISHTVETFTLTSVTATLLEALGFASDLSSAALSFTGTKHQRGVWLPDCPVDSDYGSEPGHTEADRSLTVSPSGAITGVVYTTRRHHPSIRWTHVSRARARESGETVVGSSFEAWWLDTHAGRKSYFAGVPLVRWYASSADVSPAATLQLYKPSSTAMQRSVEGWNGLYPIEIGGFAQ